MKNMKLFIVYILIIASLSSCVIHSEPPYICFAKGCVQSKKKEKGLAMKVKKARVSKPKSTPRKNSFAKNKVKQKIIEAETKDNAKKWDK